MLAQLNGKTPEVAVLTAMVATIAITVVGAVFSDDPTVYIAFGTLVCASLLNIVTQLHSSRKAGEVAEAARKAAEEAATRAEHLRRVADITHDLVNSGSLLNLRTIKELTEWKATQLELERDEAVQKDKAVKETNGLEAKEEARSKAQRLIEEAGKAEVAAREADEEYQEHKERQARVDQANMEKGED